MISGLNQRLGHPATPYNGMSRKPAFPRQDETMIVHYTRTQVSNSHTDSTTGLSGKYSDLNTLTKYSSVTVIVRSATLRTGCY
jgi:hypothetical protein